MNELKDRFKEIADYYSVSIRKLEQKFGLQRGNISNLTGAIGSDKLSKIYDNCSDINLIWLITGKGEMIKAEIQDHIKIINPDDPIASLLLDRIEKLAAENSRLKQEMNNLLTQKKYRDLVRPDIAAEPELKHIKPGKNE